MNNTVIKLAKQCPDLTLAIKAGDLLEMVETCIDKTRKELEKVIVELNSEEYYSIEQVSKMLNVSKSTLWAWANKKYLEPVHIGGKRMYRMSDIKRIMETKTNKKLSA